MEVCTSRSPARWTSYQGKRKRYQGTPNPNYEVAQNGHHNAMENNVRYNSAKFSRGSFSIKGQNSFNPKRRPPWEYRKYSSRFPAGKRRRKDFCMHDDYVNQDCMQEHEYVDCMQHYDHSMKRYDDVSKDYDHSMKRYDDVSKYNDHSKKRYGDVSKDYDHSLKRYGDFRKDYEHSEKIYENPRFEVSNYSCDLVMVDSPMAEEKAEVVSNERNLRVYESMLPELGRMRRYEESEGSDAKSSISFLTWGADCESMDIDSHYVDIDLTAKLYDIEKSFEGLNVKKDDIGLNCTKSFDNLFL